MEKKLELSRLAMEDLELASLKLLLEFPASLASFGASWDHWFVDELQDTSPRQVKILKALIQNSPFFRVGDPQQSIYLFRGARREVFEQEAQFAEQRCDETVVLDVNFRTERPVLEFLNSLFPKVSSQLQGMQVGKESDHKPCSVSLWALDSERNPQAEIWACLEKVQDLVQNQGLALHEIVVLSRTRDRLVQLQKYCREVGVPSFLGSGGGFETRPEVNEALSILQFLLSPFDNLNLVRLLRSPFVEFTDSQIAEIAKHRKTRSLWESWAQSKISDHPTRQLLLQGLQQSKEQGLGLTWLKLLKEWKIFESCLWIRSFGGFGKPIFGNCFSCILKPREVRDFKFRHGSIKFWRRSLFKNKMKMLRVLRRRGV